MIHSIIKTLFAYLFFSCLCCKLVKKDCPFEVKFLQLHDDFFQQTKSRLMDFKARLRAMKKMSSVFENPYVDMDFYLRDVFVLFLGSNSDKFYYNHVSS